MDSRWLQRLCRLALACWLAAAGAAHAQTAVASATVTGTVLDPTGAVVADASVSLRNHDTNQVIEAVSDRRGQYRFVSVPVGDYHLSVSVPGFMTANVNLSLGIGQAIDVPVKVAVAAAETVSVSGTAPLVDAGRTQVAETITPREVDSLPLNGRNYLDLALLAPNVSRTNTRSNERFAETSAVPGTGISVAGQRNIGNTFVVDGLSANDDAADLAGTYFAEDVIREFQVITSGGTAEFGRASAGTINIVTQSGTNRLRGRGYGFFRSDNLDARNALSTREDPLSHEQYGLTLSGPLSRDRTFWFANVERTDQDKTGFITIAGESVAAINARLDQVGYSAPRVVTGDFPTGYETFNLFGRVDHRLNGGSQLEIRYGFYDVASDNARGVGGLNDVSRGTRLDNRDQTAAASWLYARPPPASRSARAGDAQPSGGAGQRSDRSGDHGLGRGGLRRLDDVADRTRHHARPGGRHRDASTRAHTCSRPVRTSCYNDLTILFPGALPGTYTFTSLANFQRGQWQQFQQAFGEPAFSQSNPNLGLFVQDEWRIGPAVTLNAGLRYDLQWLPDPIQLDANNVSPRVGVAWAVDSQTVVRASAGVYFDRIPLRATSNALQRDGINYKVAVLSFGQAGAPVFPDVLPSFPSSLLTAITTMDPAIQNGRSQQTAVQIERGVGRNASVTAGYSRLRGRLIVMSRNINVPTMTAAQAAAAGVANLGRPNPNFGNISQYESIGDSWFNGLTLSAGTRATRWGSARVSYTLGTSEDTSGNAFFSSPQDSFDIAAEKGPSDNDQRHRLVVSGTLGGGTGDRLSRALAGFQFGYLIAYATGVPFNVLAGSDLNNDTNNNDRPPGVSRNSARQGSTSSVDLRLSRPFTVGGQRLEAMLEAFNLFNQVNILALNNTYGTGTAPLPTFGQPTLAGDPRQFQVGVRWSF